MSEILKISKPTMKNIADALRDKTGSENTVSARQMPGVINGLDIEKHEADGLFVGDEFYETGVITDGQYHEEGIIGPGSEYLATGCYGYEDKPYNEMIAMPYGAVDDEGNYHQSGIITTGGMVSETGILDSTGGYYDAGILNPDGEYLNQGIFGGNGTTLSTGIIDAEGDVHSAGLVDREGSYLDSGVIDRHGEAQQNGILDENGEYHQSGVCDVNGYYRQTGLALNDTTIEPTGIMDNDGEYHWDGILDAKKVYHEYGIYDNKGMHRTNGLIDSLGNGNEHGIIDKEGIYNEKGYVDSYGNFVSQGATSLPLSGEAYLGIVDYSSLANVSDAYYGSPIFPVATSCNMNYNDINDGSQVFIEFEEGLLAPVRNVEYVANILNGDITVDSDDDMFRLTNANFVGVDSSLIIDGINSYEQYTESEDSDYDLIITKPLVAGNKKQVLASLKDDDYVKNDYAIYDKSSDSAVILDGANQYNNGILDENGEYHQSGVCDVNGYYRQTGLALNDTTIEPTGIMDNDGEYHWDGILDAKKVYHEYGIYDNKGMHRTNGLIDYFGNYELDGIIDTAGNYIHYGIYTKDGLNETGGVYVDNKFYPFIPEVMDTSRASVGIQFLNNYIEPQSICDAINSGMITRAECEQLIEMLGTGIDM